MFNFSFLKFFLSRFAVVGTFCCAVISFAEESISNESNSEEKAKVEVFALPPKAFDPVNNKIPTGIAAETWESDLEFDKVFNTRKQLPQLAQYRVNVEQQANHWRICCDNAIRSARYQAEDGCISERQEVWRVASIPLSNNSSSVNPGITPDDVVQRMLQSEYKGLHQASSEEIMSWCQTTLGKNPLDRELQNEIKDKAAEPKKINCQAAAVAFCYKK